jgi:hypothetical protein
MQPSCSAAAAYALIGRRYPIAYLRSSSPWPSPRVIADKTDFRTFFAGAPGLNPNAN